MSSLIKNQYKLRKKEKKMVEDDKKKTLVMYIILYHLYLMCGLIRLRKRQLNYVDQRFFLDKKMSQGNKKTSINAFIICVWW